MTRAQKRRQILGFRVWPMTKIVKISEAKVRPWN